MVQHDNLYQFYKEHDTETVRDLQTLVDLFPLIESSVALSRWQDIKDELEAHKQEIVGAFPEEGELLGELATRATEQQAFTGFDLYSKYDRRVNVLVLDVDETLRSTGSTDNEIPQDTLNLLTKFHEEGIPIVICTGQTLESVKGFAIQGLGSEIIHSGDLSIVYETGIGVFTPGHGADSKKLLYENLDEDIQTVFTDIRSRILADAPEKLRNGCHLQGNEFNITMKPNFDMGSPDAVEVIDKALVYELKLLGDALSKLEGVSESSESLSALTRAYYADQDPEIRSVLESEDALPNQPPSDLTKPVKEILDRIDIGYYEGDAAEIGSLELSKVVGVEAAFEVLNIDDPFAVAMGDSKSDLRVMRWLEETGTGIGAAPEHASQNVLDHVRSTDELVFDEGKADGILRTIYALNLFAESA